MRDKWENRLHRHVIQHDLLRRVLRRQLRDAIQTIFTGRYCPSHAGLRSRQLRRLLVRHESSLIMLDA